jgi:hypothetical protein
MWRQQIQSWLIAAVQNLRILLHHRVSRPVRAAAAALAGMVEGAKFLREVGRIAGFRVLLGGRWITLAGLDAKGPGDL